MNLIEQLNAVKAALAAAAIPLETVLENPNAIAEYGDRHREESSPELKSQLAEALKAVDIAIAERDEAIEETAELCEQLTDLGLDTTADIDSKPIADQLNALVATKVDLQHQAKLADFCAKIGVDVPLESDVEEPIGDTGPESFKDEHGKVDLVALWNSQPIKI